MDFICILMNVFDTFGMKRETLYIKLMRNGLLRIEI